MPQKSSKLKIYTSICGFLHPVVLGIVRLMRNYKLKPLSVQPLPQESPIIFVCNHSNSHDVPTVAEVVKRHFYLLAGHEPRWKPAGLAFSMNGVIWVRRGDKQSRMDAKEKMRQLLQLKNNLLIFPEGSWNLTECLPMLPFHWGALSLAQEFVCPIVPVTLDYVDRRNCIYCIGEAMYVEKGAALSEKAAELRDRMATMRWSVWESLPNVKRQDITAKVFDVYTKDRLAEYRAFNVEQERTYTRKVYPQPSEVFETVDKLIPCRKNAFLFSNRLKGR